MGEVSAILALIILPQSMLAWTHLFNMRGVNGYMTM